jgi:serine/threonine protein kinase
MASIQAILDDDPRGLRTRYVDDSMTPNDAADLSGKTIGSYRLAHLLGEGGMGAVYLGEHLKIGSKVAIKVLHPMFAREDHVVQRFFNEARAVNLVQHQNIVSVHDFGQNDEVGAYLVMEYLEGQSLEDRLEREGRLAPSKVASLLRKIAAPLAVAHERGIIHRDLKPANIMLLPDADHPGEERIKLLDFGIAKLTDATGLGANQTRTGMLLGTPLYMSPEQCRGEREIDQRADVYALGVIAYELLAGRPPFHEGGYGSIIAQHITQEPPPLSGLGDVPVPVEAAVMQALIKDREQRFASITAFANALKGAVDSLGAAANQVSSSEVAFQRTVQFTGPPSESQLAEGRRLAEAQQTGPATPPTQVHVQQPTEPQGRAQPAVAVAMVPTRVGPDAQQTSIVRPTTRQEPVPRAVQGKPVGKGNKKSRGGLWAVLIGLLLLLGAGGATAAYLLTRGPSGGDGGGTGDVAALSGSGVDGGAATDGSAAREGISKDKSADPADPKDKPADPTDPKHKPADPADPKDKPADPTDPKHKPSDPVVEPKPKPKPKPRRRVRRRRRRKPRRRWRRRRPRPRPKPRPPTISEPPVD